jgi:hypothetical protein
MQQQKSYFSHLACLFDLPLFPFEEALVSPRVFFSQLEIQN